MSSSASSCPIRSSSACTSGTSTASPSCLGRHVEHDAVGEEPLERQLVDRLARLAADPRVVVVGRVDVRRVVRAEAREGLGRPALAVAQQPRRDAQQRLDLARALGVVVELDVGAQRVGQLGRALCDRRAQVHEPHAATLPQQQRRPAALDQPAALAERRTPRRTRRPRPPAGRTGSPRAGGSPARAPCSSGPHQVRGDRVGGRRRSSRRLTRSTASSSTPLAAAFARVASRAASSLSTATSGAKPSFAAAIASTPEPQPRSANEPPGSRSSISSSDSFVVGCAPVPNAWPGSTTRSSAPGRGGAQGGRTHSRPPTSTGSWNSLPALGPVVGDRLAAHAHAHAADVGLALRERGQLARRAVERVLDEAVAVHLLDPAGRQLQQRRQHLLGRVRGRAEREPDQRNARRSLPTIDSSAGSRRLSSVSESRSSAEQLALARGQVARDHHVEHDLLVAAAAPADRGHALAAQRHDRARLGARRARRPARRRRASARSPSCRAPRPAPGTSTTLTRSLPSRTKRSSVGDAAPARRGRPAARRARRRARGRSGGCAARRRCRPARPRRASCAPPCARGPPHAVQGSAGTRPSPPQTSQTCSRTSWPNAVRVTARTRPAPWQFVQVCTSEPGSARLPPQRSQASTRS